MAEGGRVHEALLHARQWSYARMQPGGRSTARRAHGHEMRRRDTFRLVLVRNLRCVFGQTYLRFIEGSLEVKLPTIWTDEKQSWSEAERREE